MRSAWLTRVLVLCLGGANGCTWANVPSGVCFQDGGCESGTGGGGDGVGGGGDGLAALVTVDPVSEDFGDVEANTDGGSRIWKIKNAGTGATRKLEVSSGPGLTITNGCEVALAPDAGCQIVVRINPAPLGDVSARVSVIDTPLDTLSMEFKARGMWRLTVRTDGGDGSGSVTSPGGGISCGDTCSILYAKDQAVILQATGEANGSNSRFIKFDGCVSMLRSHTCFTPSNTSILVTASFGQTQNVGFVTSQRFEASLGGYVGADRRCNDLASDAGLNTADGGGFISWISTSSSQALDRLVGDGGLYRLDGQPFVLDRNALVDERILAPLNIDERGVQLEGIRTATETPEDYGERTWAGQGCNDWTTVTDAGVNSGSVQGGPELWRKARDATCDQSLHLSCLSMSSRQAIPAQQIPDGGKIIYYTTGPGFQPGNWATPDGGLAAADNFCTLHRPPGYEQRTFAAFVGSSVRKATQLLNAAPATRYFRLDGVEVGTSAELVVGFAPNGVWVRNDGSYLRGPGRVWTGSSNAFLNSVGNESCMDWTGNSGRGTSGYINVAGPKLIQWFAGVQADCSEALPLICIER